jgi:hypothetical protein
MYQPEVASRAVQHGIRGLPVTEISFERWIGDLECVVDALSLNLPNRRTSF